jgi:Ni,Fe-hydrogenase I large subunit
MKRPPSGAGYPARGIAQVEAVRGRLVHGIEQENGLVRRYVIVAPTEWNFHPQGAAMRGLAAIAASRRDGWQQIADLFIATVDPCVGYELRVS